ncbi:MAG: hypothetical protein ACRERX_11425 [Pseudomonas sp.]
MIGELIAFAILAVNGYQACGLMFSGLLVEKWKLVLWRIWLRWLGWNRNATGQDSFNLGEKLFRPRSLPERQFVSNVSEYAPVMEILTEQLFELRYFQVHVRPCHS